MASGQLHIDLPARYRASRHIATGGMAAVYAATDEVLGREVAIKVLAAGLAADPDARERFAREARAAARVSAHPHVATIYDIAENEGDPPLAFIVMELVTGGTVHDRLRAGEPIPHTLALRWLEQTASALDAAHAEGMVHRDVKPANLLLDASDNVKVADFGIALLATDSPLTQTGQVIGTATYFSPEQAMGRPATPASDRYALATLAYELLTGHRPFPPGPPAAQALARIESTPPPATSVAPGLPDGVDAVLAQGLAKEPGDRPRSAADLVGRLHAALGPTVTTGVTRPVAAAKEATPRPRTPRPPVAAAVPTRARTPRPAPVAPAPRRRSNRAGVLAGLAALVLVIGAGIAALAGGGDDPKDTASTPETTTERTRTERRTTEEPATTAASTGAAPAPVAEEPEGPPADAAAIQAAAHEKLAGDPQGAADMLAGLVGRCPVADTNPCAYAWYDYGVALHALGRYDEAVSAFEVRAQNPDQADTVQAALAEAQAAAAGGSESPGNGKAKGKFKEKDD